MREGQTIVLIVWAWIWGALQASTKKQQICMGPVNNAGIQAHDAGFADHLLMVILHNMHLANISF